MFSSTRYKPKYNQDYIIILGCGIRKDGTLYPLLQGRADRAIKFYKDQLEANGKAAIFIPSGGQGSDEIIPEGTAIKNYLLEKNIPKEHIISETNSKNTFENMQFSKKVIEEDLKEKAKELLNDANILFSTTNYHIFRSGMIASQAGLFAKGIGSKAKWYYSPNAQIREFVGLIVGKWKIHALVTAAIIAMSVIIAQLDKIILIFL